MNLGIAYLFRSGQQAGPMVTKDGLNGTRTSHTLGRVKPNLIHKAVHSQKKVKK